MKIFGVYFAKYSLERLRWIIQMRDMTLHLTWKRHAFLKLSRKPWQLSHAVAFFLQQKSSEMERNRKKF